MEYAPRPRKGQQNPKVMENPPARAAIFSGKRRLRPANRRYPVRPGFAENRNRIWPIPRGLRGPTSRPAWRAGREDKARQRRRIRSALLKVRPPPSPMTADPWIIPRPGALCRHLSSHGGPYRSWPAGRQPWCNKPGGR